MQVKLKLCLRCGRSGLLSSWQLSEVTYIITEYDINDRR